MRGLAVLCMIEHHTFDAFLAPGLHGTAPDRLFRFLGGVAAPSFLFLAGLAIVLMMERQVARGLPVRAASLGGVRRGLWIFAGAYLFRLQEWALAFGGAPWTDLMRIDVLNCIGVALVLVSLAWGASRRPIALCLLLAAATALLAPLVWSAPLGFLPQHLADYLHGQEPRALFPLFPWVAHAFAGAAVGVIVARTAREAEARMMLGLCLLCGAVWVATRFVDDLPFTLYPQLSWWATSPAYFVLRSCTSVWLLAACWLADAWLPGKAFKDPLLVLGQHSLAVYWVHIEIVYGRWFWRSRGTLPLGQGVLVFAAVLLSMIALACAIGPVRTFFAALFGRGQSAAAAPAGVA